MERVNPSTSQSVGIASSMVVIEQQYTAVSGSGINKSG
jgi:hypothetical protein